MISLTPNRLSGENQSLVLTIIEAMQFTAIFSSISLNTPVLTPLL